MGLVARGTLGLLAAILCLGAWNLLAPTPCSEVTKCLGVLKDSQRYHGHLAMGLCVLLLREASVLLASFIESCSSKAQIWSKEQCLCPALLTANLFILLMFEVRLSQPQMPWVHVGMGRPVYTVRYAEWLCTVPLLLLLTGCGALGLLSERR